MTEDALLRALPLADRLRIAAVDVALTGARRALAVACWRAAEGGSSPGPGRLAPGGADGSSSPQV